MSGYDIRRLPFLTDPNGRLVGVISANGQEVFFPTFDALFTSLLKPDGTALSGSGVGYVLQPATGATLGGIKVGSGLTVAADGTLNASGGGSGGAQASGTATSDDTLVPHSLIYIKSTGNCGLADNTAEGKEALAFVLASVAPGATATFYMVGSLITGFSGLTPGAPYYLGTAGNIVTLANAPIATGNVLMKIGTAISASTMVFAPEAPVTL